ncbi:phosphatidylcholine synthase [Actinomycetaceae bacterium TAE3-ERU4]|nr:phosphatidylcholine synthase [Actinomycetaceae bacterium TAE3-ERU4]
MSSYTLGQKVAAWSVHAFTMTGVAWAVLALLSLINGHVGWMWLWLSVALLVDAIDGTFARAAKVSEVVPWFDGVILDDIVDYLTWTFIPAIFMYLYLPLGPRWLAAVIVVMVATSSMFCYANKGMKAQDNYFVGFPAAWNIAAMYFYVLETGPIVNVIVSLVVMSLTLSTLTFVHPLRVRTWMPLNIAVTVGWLVTTGFLLVARVMDSSAVDNLWVFILWWIFGIYFIGIGIVRTVLGRRKMEELAGIAEEEGN